MTTILTRASRAIVCALMLTLAACGSTHTTEKPSAAPPAVAVSTSSAQYSALSAAQTPDGRKIVGAKDPAVGNHEIDDHLQWWMGMLADKRPFYWATISGTNPDNGVQTITLIAGEIGRNGVMPPLKAGEKFTPGITICQTKGDDMHPEVVMLNQGFLCVNVSPTPASPKKQGPGKANNPFKLIIRTHAVPAGAYSTDYVLLDLGLLTDTQTREYVFRPNQDEFNKPDGMGECEGTSKVDHEGFGKVSAHPPESAKVMYLTDASYIVRDYDGKSPTDSDSPYPWNPEESKFMSGVCEFVKAANIAIKKGGSKYDWKCEPVKPPPKAK